MATVNVNGKNYEVHEEVADQFNKFILKSKEQEELISTIKAQFKPKNGHLDLTDRGCAETLKKIHQLID